MSGMLSLMYVQSLFQFAAKVGKWEGYYGEKNDLDMSFTKRKNVRRWKRMTWFIVNEQKCSDVQLNTLFAH